MSQSESIQTFWEAFLMETNRDLSTRYADCYHFCTNEESANALLQLVLQGKKTATSSSKAFYDKANIPLPQVGDLCIITDWNSHPYCVVETTRVMEMQFQDMTYDICKREGEDDDLASWQRGHIKFFSEEGAQFGYLFSWDMSILFEDFKVIYVK